MHYKKLHGAAVGSSVSNSVQKLWCNTWRNAPSQLVDKRYRFGNLRRNWRFHDYLNEQNATSTIYQSNRRKWKTSFSRLVGKPRQQQTTNELRYDTYWPTLKTGTNPTTGRIKCSDCQVRTLVRLAGTSTRDWHEQSHHCTSSTHKPHPWLEHCPMLKLQYELFSTTDSE